MHLGLQSPVPDDIASATFCSQYEPALISAISSSCRSRTRYALLEETNGLRPLTGGASHRELAPPPSRPPTHRQTPAMNAAGIISVSSVNHSERLHSIRELSENCNALFLHTSGFRGRRRRHLLLFGSLVNVSPATCHLSPYLGLVDWIHGVASRCILALHRRGS